VSVAVFKVVGITLKVLATVITCAFLALAVSWNDDEPTGGA
jgi:hypothetical protein